MKFFIITFFFMVGLNATDGLEEKTVFTTNTETLPDEILIEHPSYKGHKIKPRSPALRDKVLFILNLDDPGYTTSRSLSLIYNRKLIRKIQLEHYPIDFSVMNRCFYFLNRDPASVGIFDMESGKTSLIKLNRYLTYGLLSADLHKYFVLSSSEGMFENEQGLVNIINTKTQALDEQSIDIKGDPVYAIQSKDSKLYVLSLRGGFLDTQGFVSIIDMEKDTLIGKPILIGKGPQHAIFSTKGDELFISNRNSCSVSVIDTKLNQVSFTIPVIGRPTRLILSKKSGKLYVLNEEKYSISVIDIKLKKVVETISAGICPADAILCSDDNKLIVVNYGSLDVTGTLSIFTFKDESSQAKVLGVEKTVRTIPLGKWQDEIILSGETLYITGDTVQLVDMQKIDQVKPYPMQFIKDGVETQ